MKITFLGTASAFPTRERNHSGLLVDIGPEAFLFDCGENIQKQLRIAGISPMKISKIFISHWHGDHVLGLPGLLQSMELNGRQNPIEIYGPEETKERLHFLRKALSMQTSFPINAHEIKTGKVFVADEFEVLAQKVTHPITCFAFAFVQKQRLRIDKDKIKKHGVVGPAAGTLAAGKDIVWEGKTIKAKDVTYVKPAKKMTYIIDAAFDPALAEFAKDSDVLICEATFDKELAEDAKKKGHMTAQQAAKLAIKSKSKQLIITHFSQRYKDVSGLLAEAKKEFKNTLAAKDFLEIKI